MQEGTRAHTSNVTKGYLEAHQVKTMTWPASSPDHNPIENVWQLLTQAV